MDEVAGILIALGGLIGGLLILGWAYGDFNTPKGTSGTQDRQPTEPASPSTKAP